MVNQESKTRIEKYITENPKQKLPDIVPLILKGQKKKVAVFRLPIELLYYNIRNGRFAAEYKSLVKKHGGELKAEEPNDAKKIKQLLFDLDKNETSRTYDDIKAKGQWVPGIITEDGYVIDGNRRMAILTQLFEDTADDNFKYLNVAKLDEPISSNDLWKLEAGIQLGKDEILRYGPINELLKLNEGVKAGISIKEIAKTLYGFDDESEIKERLGRLELIKQYLIFIGEPEDFEKAKRVHEHFINLQDIIETEKKYNTDPDLRVTIKRVVFQLIQDGIQHLELRKIKKMVRLHLDDALRELERAKDYSKPKKPTVGETGLDDEVEKVIEDQPETEDKETEDEEPDSPATTHFRNAADILDAEENKDQVLQLLRKAETYLSGIDYQSDDLQKPESKEIIRKILKHSKKLEDVE
jgi:hypothetical protein